MNYTFLALAAAMLGGAASAGPAPEETPPAIPVQPGSRRIAQSEAGYPCPVCGSRGWGRYCTGPGHYRRRVRR